MDLIVTKAKTGLWGSKTFRCGIGRGGLLDVAQKREGDSATPIGRWPVRDVFYRADRISRPATGLSLHVLNPDDGWCEKPDDDHYNQMVRHPYPGVTDRLWREDHIYDIIVVLGYNDDPVVPGKGSAIFLHLARPDYGPSAGCVTLSLDDMLSVLREAKEDMCVDVRG